MLRRRVDRTTRDLEWKCTKAEDQADLCTHRVLKDLQEDRKTENLSQNRTILSILAEFF
jgi:hypothetical protein